MNRCNPSIFIGYPIGTKAYKVMTLANETIHLLRDFKFFENIFPSHYIIKHPFDSPIASFLPISSKDTYVQLSS